MITPAEIVENNGYYFSSSFWCVVDGFVVDATDFMKKHPGGIKKLLEADKAEIGASGKEFGFSFSQGRNAHFPATGKKFKDGVESYLSGGIPGMTELPSTEVFFEPYGKIVILGKLSSHSK